jgi:2-oxo-4-hydroxy-4-carboxy-5-ureidoimidazoline decarboxylase
MTIEDLDAMDRDAFIDALGWVFERAPWVAERVWPQRPFDTVEALHAAMANVVADAPLAEQLALIRAHPDLGAKARMSDASTQEQSGAGLDRMSPDAFQRLHKLNAAYREKFGFPFIYAVKGSTADGILRALEARISADPESERATALAHIRRIAQFRLEDLFRVPVHERQ